MQKPVEAYLATTYKNKPTELLLTVITSISLCEPRPEVLDIWQNLIDVPPIHAEPFLLEPVEHEPGVGDEAQHDARQDLKRHGHVLSGNLLVDRGHLGPTQLITADLDDAVLERAALEKRPRGHAANVPRGDDLKWPSLDLSLPRRREDLAEEAAGEVLHEGHGAEDGVARRRVGADGGEEVLLDAVLAGKVRHVGGLVAVAGAGGVDEVLDAVFQRRVYEGLALALLVGGTVVAGRDRLSPHVSQHMSIFQGFRIS